ncbi:hypothetical protein Q3G72_014338 [Acer saccharum]|nr:hypothetical protein Q3G72_014338 [Acer saccharum]
MITYLDIAKRLLRWFKKYKITQIPREENEKADALSKLASATTCIRSKTILIAHMTKPSTAEPVEIMIAEIRPCPNDWTTQLRRYLEEHILPEDTAEAKRIRIANDIRQLPELLRSLTSPWPFTMWGLDLIGPMPTGVKEGAKHAIVAVDYFTKWIEAEALIHIIKSEIVNKVIKHTLKAKLDSKKGNWTDKLHEVLWAYRTTARTSTGEIIFSLAFRTEALIPAKTTFTLPKVQLYNPDDNLHTLLQNLDELEEARDRAQVRNTADQQRAARYYNSHVRVRKF